MTLLMHYCKFLPINLIISAISYLPSTLIATKYTYSKSLTDETPHLYLDGNVVNIDISREEEKVDISTRDREKRDIYTGNTMN